MSRITRCAVLAAALLSVFAVMSSVAGAVTWEANGDQTFTATAGASTLSGFGVSLVCTSADASGAVVNSDFTPGGTWDFASATMQFTGCTLAGSPATMACSARWTPIALHGTPVTTSTGIEDTTCSSYVLGTKICHVEGQESWTGHNPVPPTAMRWTRVTAIDTGTGADCPVRAPCTGRR